MATLQDALSPGVRAFAEREGLLDSLQLAVELVQEHFPEMSRLDAELVSDPETEERWVALTVRVPVPVEDLLARDEPFLARWVAGAPWPQRGRIALLVHPA